MNHPLFIAVGYSVRSLVEACSRAGLECIAVDHFGDADTRSFARGRWIELKLVDERLLTVETLSAIVKLVTDCCEGSKFAFLLAGGMENLGEAVEQLRGIGTVLGPTETQRLKLRDWKYLQGIAKAAGIEFPRTLSPWRTLPASGVLADSVLADAGSVGHEHSWLWKPVRGAGGLKITRAEKEDPLHSQGYLQQYIAGRQLGITCKVQDDGCRVVGATRSLAAVDWPGPSEFIYRGSLGPVQLADDAHGQVTDLCVQIQQQLGYSGLLQFDFIQDADGRLLLLECNPRWTAGMEVLLGYFENAEQTRAFILDGGIVESSRNRDRAPGRMPSGVLIRTFAKAIVYAEREIHLTESVVRELQSHHQADAGSFTWLADIPHAEQTIELGHPIATIRASLHDPSGTLSEAETYLRLLAQLRQHAERLRELTFRRN